MVDQVNLGCIYWGWWCGWWVVEPPLFSSELLAQLSRGQGCGGCHAIFLPTQPLGTTTNINQENSRRAYNSHNEDLVLLTSAWVVLPWWRKLRRAADKIVQKAENSLAEIWVTGGNLARRWDTLGGIVRSFDVAGLDGYACLRGHNSAHQSFHRNLLWCGLI